jgi:hypothetical protein
MDTPCMFHIRKVSPSVFGRLLCPSQYHGPEPLSSMTLNCNLAQTLHDMPNGHVRHLRHLGNWTDDMPSSYPNTILGYWLDDMPSSHPDSFGPFGLLSHLSYLSTIGNLNTLDPEPIDVPLHAFIEEKEPT